MGYRGMGVHNLSANRVLSCGMGCLGYENSMPQNSCYDQQHSFFTTSKGKLLYHIILHHIALFPPYMYM